MSSSNPNDLRASKLSVFFNNVLHGQRTLATSRDGKLFLEALCVQADPATCAHKILSSPCGLPALQASVRFDTSVTFLNEHATVLLRYLQAPSLKTIESGSVLAKLLVAMVEPPFFWEALIKSFTGELLNLDASQNFAWLLLQLVCLPGKASSPYITVASSPNVLDSILKSPQGETRILGQKIKHALPLDPAELCQDAEVKPGGRHDNDHADYREISIMPTADELLSKDRPFFRAADDPELLSSRSATHIDNQFRLLREDMLGEIRDELKILTGKKTGRHRGITINNLSPVRLKTGTDRQRSLWGVVFRCNEELPCFKRIKPDKRKDFLKDNAHILRHGNMACLLIDDEPAAFPTIWRDVEDLSKSPAHVTLQFVDDATLPYALSKMKRAANFKLVQLDTAIFAFEPFLRRLQEMKELPLADELLHWNSDTAIEGPTFQPDTIIR